VVLAGSMRDPVTDQYRGVIGRLTSSGALDPSWDADGWAELTVAGQMTISAIAIQPLVNVGSFGIVVTGITWQTSGQTVGPSSAYVVRYTSNGSLDSSFNGGQVFKRLDATAWALAVLPAGISKQAGKILVGGGIADNFWLTQLLPDGLVDRTFGGLGFGLNVQSPGEVIFDFGSRDLLRGIALQPDGKFVTIGTSGNRLRLNRHLGNGALDTSFSSGAKVTSTQTLLTKSVVIQMVPESLLPPKPARARIIGAAKSFDKGGGDLLLAFLP
jgi:uncharacterized delta-60 repeat protein